MWENHLFYLQISFDIFLTLSFFKSFAAVVLKNVLRMVLTPSAKGPVRVNSSPRGVVETFLPGLYDDAPHIASSNTFKKPLYGKRSFGEQC